MVVITKSLDLINKQFDYCTVIERVENSKAGKSRWLCKCICGKEFVTVGSQLLSGHTKSCGCMEGKLKSLSKTKIINNGEKFGKLTVIDYIGNKNGRSIYKCKCDCGNVVMAHSNHLKTGNTTSCGCSQKENTSKSLKQRWENGVQLHSIQNAIHHSKPETDMIELIKSKYKVLDVKELFGYFPDCIVEIDGQLFDVEYDGYYWHSNAKSIEHDNIRNKIFNNNGYRVIRFLCSDRYSLSIKDIDEAFKYMLFHDDDTMIFNKMNK